MSNATDHPATDTTAGAPALLGNPAGGYRVLPGGAAYCTGVIPDDGFEVVRVQLDPWLPLNEGYQFIEQYRARPPIAGGEVELEARGARETVIVATRARAAASPS